MGQVFFAGGKVDMEGLEIPENFEDATWAQIVAACQMDKVPDTWVVGDQKAMTINGTDYLIDIIGKDHDKYSDGRGTAPLTLQLHDCYAEDKAMNSTNTNIGGWTDSAMRNTHLPAILALMPPEVQAGIREVNKMTSAGNSSTTINTTADKLFLLSESEVTGSVTGSQSGEGSQYEYYAAGNSKLKEKDGYIGDWWTRSPAGGDATFCCVTEFDSIQFTSASAENWVSFAFCF